MGKVQGKFLGADNYEVGPAAVVGGEPSAPRKLTNHFFGGPDYSIIHPGIFPHNADAQELATLGGQPIRIDSGYHRQLRRKAGLPANLLELLALTCVVEERARKRYEEHTTRSDVAPETLDILNEMRVDEEAHLAWITEKLTELGAKEGQGKVTAVLQRYRAVEATVFADMQHEEQRALAEVMQDKTQQV